MKAFITKVLSFIKRVFLSIRAVVSLRLGIGKEEETDEAQDTHQKGE